MRNSIRTIWIFVLIASGIFLDQISKHFLLNVPDISLIGNILRIHREYNTGVAFSFPLSGILLHIVTVLCIFGIVYYYVREEFQKRSALLDVGYALLLSGGLSHAYDRIMEWRVFDFIALQYFAVFNIADIIISVGAGCIILYYLSYGRTR